jgi:hypothetical protein
MGKEPNTENVTLGLLFQTWMKSLRGCQKTRINWMTTLTPFARNSQRHFYILRSGCSWRMLPHDLPPWKTVYHYFRKWRKDGTFQQINDSLRTELRVTEGHNAQPSAAKNAADVIAGLPVQRQLDSDLLHIIRNIKNASASAAIGREKIESPAIKSRFQRFRHEKSSP